MFGRGCRAEMDGDGLPIVGPGIDFTKVCLVCRGGLRFAMSLFFVLNLGSERETSECASVYVMDVCVHVW